MKVREYQKNDYLISTDPSKLQIDVIYNFLSNCYWSKNIPLNILQNAIDNSICFGVYKQNTQVGFARLITDLSTFAYLVDVFILDKFRGKGLSKWLLEVMVNYPELQGLRTWMLKTDDAHELYRKYGFTSPQNPEKIMELSLIKSYDKTFIN